MDVGAFYNLGRLAQMIRQAFASHLSSICFYFLKHVCGFPPKPPKMNSATLDRAKHEGCRQSPLSHAVDVEDGSIQTMAVTAFCFLRYQHGSFP